MYAYIRGRRILNVHTLLRYDDVLVFIVAKMDSVDMKAYTTRFHEHSDALCQAARFVSSACSESKSRLRLPYLFVCF